MSAAGSFLNDLAQFIINFPRTYIDVVFRPRRLCQILDSNDSSVERYVTPLAFLLFCSFTLTFVARQSSGSIVAFFVGARSQIQAGANSGFDVLKIFISAAPVFLMVMFVGAVLSGMIARFFAIPSSRLAAAKEIRQFLWYSAGGQIFTIALLILFPMIAQLVWYVFVKLQTLDEMRALKHWRWPLVNLIMGLYVFFFPFMVGREYFSRRYRRSSSQKLDPGFGILIFAFASSAAVYTSIAALRPGPIMVRAVQDIDPSKVILSTGSLSTVNREPIEIERDADGSVAIHLIALVYNGYDSPVYIMRWHASAWNTTSSGWSGVLLETDAPPTAVGSHSLTPVGMTITCIRCAAYASSEHGIRIEISANYVSPPFDNRRMWSESIFLLWYGTHVFSEAGSLLHPSLRPPSAP